MNNIVQFPHKAPQVVPQRIAEARMALQMPRTEVARALRVTGQAIGHYESGDRQPDMSTLLELSKVLRQPVSFFFRPLREIAKKRASFFRSVGPKSNKINLALDVRTQWLWEFVQTLLDFNIRLPTPNIPLFDDPPQNDIYSLRQIEYLAAKTRRYWGMGDGPINNMVALLESQGVIVCRFEIGSQKIDAFSCWIDGRPYVLLGSEKSSSVRSRFDAAHELGHLILHRDISKDDLESKAMRDRVEREANWFAGAFLLPRNVMFREFYSTRAPHLQGMKERWRVSMQAIAHRAKDIGAIDEQQYIAFRIQMTKRKMLTKEPLDNVIPLERPGLLYNAWQKLIEKKQVSEFHPDDAIGFSRSVISDHFGRQLEDTDPATKAALALLHD